MTTEAAKKIGSVLGEVFAPMNPKLFDGGHFIRIQVSIDLSLPLCCGRLVSVGEGGKQLWISFKYERLPNICYWCGRLTYDDRDCDLWIDSEGTLKPEQHEFGPYLRAPPFVATRCNAIMVLGFYAEKKKTCSGKSEERNSGWNSVSGRGRTPKQPQEVMANTNDCIEADEIVSLKRNEEVGIMREDTMVQNRVNEETIGELNTPKEIEIEVEACNEELSLAKEFGVAKFLGLGRKANKNPTPCDNSSPIACDNLSGTSSLKLSRDTEGNRVHKQKSPRTSRTWTCRKRINPKNNTTK